MPKLNKIRQSKNNQMSKTIDKSLEKQTENATSSFAGRMFIIVISFIMIVMVFFSGLNSCSPVRTNLSKKEPITKDNKPKKSQKTTKNSPNENEYIDLVSEDEGELFDFTGNDKNKPNEKHSKNSMTSAKNLSNDKNMSDDTLDIEYPPISSSNYNLFDFNEDFDFTPEFEKAVLEFDINFIEKACNKFDFFASTLNPTDTLYFESLFYKSECLITRLEYAQAERLLNRIIKNKNTPEPVLQKSIVRIGHIYCAMGSKELAEKTFEEFKNDYPNSKLVKLANCNAIKISKK